MLGIDNKEDERQKSCQRPLLETSVKYNTRSPVIMLGSYDVLLLVLCPGLLNASIERNINVFTQVWF